VDDDSDFEGKVRSRRGANRAVTKAQQAKFDKLKIGITE
jgi:hypothetical protein